LSVFVRLFAIVFTAALLSLSGGLARRACAEPYVRVRGESRIELGVAHLELGVAVTGALRDELGAPLAGRVLAIEAQPLSGPREPFRDQRTTDAEGRFALELPDTAQDYRLLATFAGDATHRGVRVERRVERARSDVRLELRLPFGHTIDLDAPELVVEAVAESDVGGNGVAMRLWDEAGRELGKGVTDRAGRLRLRIATTRMGGPGAGLVRIESLRDDRRAEAQTEARVVRRRAVFLALRPSATEIEAGQPVRVRGTASTRVAPRPFVPVGLFAAERHLATVLTDAQGEFRADLWLETEPGPLELTARTEGDATGSYPAAETRIRLRIAAARPVPLGWVLLAAAAIAAIAWLSTRFRARGVRDDPEPRVREPTEPSILPARAHGRRDRHAVSGRVLDLRGERAVAHARIEIVHGQPETSCVLASDEDGRFESPALPNGRARLRVEAGGYVSTEIELELPHRGEWSAVVIRLESERARALAAFRTLALKALPSPRAWGIWTARETREWLAERAPGQRGVLRQLTRDVERACYGRDQPVPEEVNSIERTAEAVAEELRAHAAASRERRPLR
jgi:hypothetical protein